MANAREAKRITLTGRIQGVGFRPFVLRLASQLGLKGWVRNAGGVVDIHVEGDAVGVDRFIEDLGARPPAFSRPSPPVVARARVEDYADFSIQESVGAQASKRSVPPDCFVCPECLAEMNDPRQRRYRYPFTNCTQCGPRYTIIDALPYDRARTSMARFPLCDDCAVEYATVSDRRYHAQPLACPACGPRLEFRRARAAPATGNEPALAACVRALESGDIVAVKGVGGYHLVCDGTRESTILKLRDRKHRPSKPFAVMVPESRLDPERMPPAVLESLRSPLRPVVLAPKRALCDLPDAIAPGLDEIGLILPYSPLHHLLAERFGRPMVATSGNVSGEPILIDPQSAQQRLGSVADAFLHHDRPIRRPADDSVLRVVAGVARPIRIGRGLAPLEFRTPKPVKTPLLAVGGDLKNTIALAAGDRLVMSPHLGDLAAPRARQTFEQVVRDLGELYAIRPEIIVCDRHPGYHSRKWAEAQGLPVIQVLHHHAHASAAYAELAAEGDALAFTWDGLGYGEDGALWGGEALFGRPGAWRRVGSIRPFAMIGGEKASREPWRCALAVCLEAGLDWPDAPAEAALAAQMWRKEFNCPETTSVGRLFDAASALLGLSLRQSYEGEAAMRLESAAGIADVDADALPCAGEGDLVLSDWRPLLRLLLDNTMPVAARASYFHAALSGLLVEQAIRLRDLRGASTVLLCGGVFQNRLLAETTLAGLARAGFRAFLPQRFPVNDASLSLGQIIEANALRA